MKTSKTYSQDFKDKVVKEFEETKNLSVVARTNSVPINTLRQWVLKKYPQRDSRIPKRQTAKLEKEIQALKYEIELLKELLKKTNQAWLKV